MSCSFAFICVTYMFKESGLQNFWWLCPKLKVLPLHNNWIWRRTGFKFVSNYTLACCPTNDIYVLESEKK